MSPCWFRRPKLLYGVPVSPRDPGPVSWSKGRPSGKVPYGVGDGRSHPPPPSLTPTPATGPGPPVRPNNNSLFPTIGNTLLLLKETPNLCFPRPSQVPGGPGVVPRSLTHWGCPDVLFLLTKAHRTLGFSPSLTFFDSTLLPGSRSRPSHTDGGTRDASGRLSRSNGHRGFVSAKGQWVRRASGVSDPRSSSATGGRLDGPSRTGLTGDPV